MPKYDETFAALIRGDEVVDTIVVDPDDAEFLEELAGDFDAVEIVGDRDRPSPGWIWDGNVWTPPASGPEPEPTPPTEPAVTDSDRLERIEQVLQRIETKLAG